MTLVSPPELDAEALIAEARAERRRRWRRNALVVMAALVAVAAAVGGYEGLRSSPPAPVAAPFGSSVTATWHLAGPTAWDGGTPPNFALAQQSSVSCAGASTCYVAVQAYGYQPDGSLIVPDTPPGLSPFRTTAYRSADGGRTWSRLALPTATYLSSAISCSSGSRCAVGARTATSTAAELGTAAAVLTTADGGRSWQQHRLPSWAGLATSVTCPTATRCVAVVEDSTRATVDGMAPWDGANRFYASSILTTADGGRTWSTVALPGRSGDRYLNLDALSCPTTRDCIVTGERAAIVPRTLPSAGGSGYVIGASTGVVLSSVDGGRTFTSRVQPAVPVVASCPTPASCVALARGSGPGPAVVLAGGVTGPWRTVPAAGLPAAFGDALSPLSSLACPTAGHCLAVGGPGLVEVTTDGGRTWRAGHVPTGAPAAASPAATSSGSTAATSGSTAATSGSTTEASSGACTSSGRCLLLSTRPAASATAAGPTRLQVLVNG